MRSTQENRTNPWVLIVTLIAVVLARGTFAAVLQSNQEIGITDHLDSDNGTYRLAWTTTGTTHLLRFAPGVSGQPSEWRSMYDGAWSGYGLGSHTNQWNFALCSCHAVMQSDGNFVMYNGDYSVSLWATQTNGNNGAYLNAQDDGNLVVYTSGGSPLWSLW